MEDKSPDIGALDFESPGAVDEPPLGKLLAAARQKRGLSADDLALRTRIPAHYVKMIESDDYALISDQLYLVPFVRRYAAFLQLDPEEAAMRFVREVQRADSNAVRMSEPIAMVAKRHSPWRIVIPILVAIAILVAYGAFSIYRRYSAMHAGSAAPRPTIGASNAPAIHRPAAPASAPAAPAASTASLPAANPAGPASR